MNIVCLSKSVETPANLRPHCLTSTSSAQPSLRLKQLLPHGSRKKEVCSGEQFLLQRSGFASPRNKKANKTAVCSNPLQECLWISSAPAQSSLCVPPGRLQFLLSTHTGKNCKKIAGMHPRVWGSPAFAYTSTFLPTAGRETEGQAYEMRTNPDR